MFGRGKDLDIESLTKKKTWLQQSVHVYSASIFLILIIVGVVAFLNPHGSISDNCDTGSELECVDFIVGATGLVIDIKNNVKSEVEITSIELKGCKNEYRSLTIKPGEAKFIPIDGCEIKKDYYAGDIKINYKPKNSLSENSVTGNIIGKKQDVNIYSVFKQTNSNNSQSNKEE